MGLTEYNKKRNFQRTPEPPGTRASAKQKLPKQKSTKTHRPSFLIQKHDASHLHYDFRLELDGVLKSWAVPKGPSLDPEQKRLAVHVEDHPLEYGSFEGSIPAGEYGGGTVLLWDRGEWEPDLDPRAGYKKGHLKFTLFGEKLHGKWALIRTKRQAENSDKEHWLLIKERDEFSKSESVLRITDALPDSVVSGRDLAAIAKDPGNTWSSKSKKPKTKLKTKSKTNSKTNAGTKSKTKVPQTWEPELATLATEAPNDDDWVHEIKFDGYRILCRIDGSDVRLLTRNGLDWSLKFPDLVAELRTLPCQSAILDGEVVVFDKQGRSDFQALQHALSGEKPAKLHYALFDLVHLDGIDLTKSNLLIRKSHLKDILSSTSKNSCLRYSDHVQGSGQEFYKHVCGLKLEGMISKRIDAPYRSGRGKDWLKTKCANVQEFVIGGFTEPDGSRVGFGALLVGLFEADGKFKYVGRVGTGKGFHADFLKKTTARLKKLRTASSPFFNTPHSRGGGVTFVKPELVVNVHFASWTSEGVLRQASFQGFREDKPAVQVTPEVRVTPEVQEKPSPKKSDKVEIPQLTHADRELFPGAGITKRDLVEYYTVVSERMLPYVADRALTLLRCPGGSTDKCFYQRNHTGQMPESIVRVRRKENGKNVDHLVIRDNQGLTSLVQLGALEIHPWGARLDADEKPDQMIFDLDPDPEVPWKTVVSAAFKIKERLAKFQLESFVKVTGGKGVHIVVPLKPLLNYDDVKAVSLMIAQDVSAQNPGEFTTQLAKEKRKGKIFIDYLRNGLAATAVAPYSIRARPGAPVALPISWEELTPKLKANAFNIQTVLTRLKKSKDPWADFDTKRCDLSAFKSLLKKRG